PSSSRDPRRRRAATLAPAAPRWLRCFTRSRRGTRLLQAVTTKPSTDYTEHVFCVICGWLCASGAVKNHRQLVRVFAFKLERAADGSEGFGKRKDIARH